MAGGDGFHSLPSKCPYRVAPAVTSGTAALLPVTLSETSFTAEQHVTSLPEAVSLPATFDTFQQRGPPIA
jgi:hypothetical protein